MTMTDEQRKDDAKELRSIERLFLGTIVFCLIALFTPDTEFILGAAKIKVPLAGDVPLSGFLWLGPGVLFVLRIYLQILYERRDELEGAGSPQDRAGSCWLTVFELITAYLALPVAMLAFAWKAAVFPVPGLLLAVAAVLAATIPLWIPLVSAWKRSGCNTTISIVFTAAGLLFVILSLNGNWKRSFDLSQAQLTGQVLARSDFSYATLRSTNLTFSDLSGAILDHADLRYARLDGALLVETKFKQANLTQASFGQTRLVGTGNPTGPNAVRADFENAQLFCSLFEDAKLGPIHNPWPDDDPKPWRTRFVGADLGAARFVNVDLTDADFTNADLRGAIFDEKTRIDGAIFTGADLRNAVFAMVPLAEVWRKNPCAFGPHEQRPKTSCAPRPEGRPLRPSEKELVGIGAYLCKSWLN